MRLKFFFLLSVFALAISCKKHKEEVVDLQYGYFPLEKGRFVIYRVREINVDAALAKNDTLDYFIKTKIGDTITDNSGRLNRRFERYKVNNLSQPWVLKDIWTTIITEGRAELVEENQRTIKLVFAPDINKEWNANAYNMLSKLDCKYIGIHLPGSINGFSFDSTLRVEQEKYISLVDYHRKFESYAKGIGMVSKFYKDYRIANYDTLQVTKGSEIIMELVNYGVE